MPLTGDRRLSANDFSFFEDIDNLVQAEPVDALDPELTGQLAAIGIVKGKPLSAGTTPGSESMTRNGSPNAPGSSRISCDSMRWPVAIGCSTRPRAP